MLGMDALPESHTPLPIELYGEPGVVKRYQQAFDRPHCISMEAILAFFQNPFQIP